MLNIFVIENNNNFNIKSKSIKKNTKKRIFFINLVKMLTQHLTNMLERVIIQLRHDDNIIQKYVPSLTYVLDILIFLRIQKS